MAVAVGSAGLPLWGDVQGSPSPTAVIGSATTVMPSPAVTAVAGRECGAGHRTRDERDGGRGEHAATQVTSMCCHEDPH